jgi:hypothetical protein
MAKSKSLPDQCTVLRRYDELEEYVRAFAEGHLNLVLLFGCPGTAKSRTVRDIIGKNALWIEGNGSAFGIYQAAFQHRNQPIVLDDIDGLYRDERGVRLLKTLCQTEAVKRLNWQTNAPILDQKGIPRQFETTSRVLLIANTWKSLNDNVVALEDRGHVLQFEPSALEIHRRVFEWFWSQDVFDFVGDHLHLLQSHSMRVYLRAYELQRAGMDWKPAILSRCLSGTALEVAKLKADSSFETENDRVRAFVESGAGSRATYFNYTKKMKPAETVPRLILVHTAPPLDRVGDVDILEFLRRRHGRLGNG